MAGPTGHRSGSALGPRSRRRFGQLPANVGHSFPRLSQFDQCHGRSIFRIRGKENLIPVVYRDCTIPFRLRRVQYVDFRHDYARGLKELRKTLALEQKAGQSTPAISDIPSLSDAINVTEIDQRESTPEAHRRKAAEDATQDDVRHTMPCLLLDMTEVAGPMIRCLLRAAAVGEIPGQQKVCAFHPVSIQNPK